jgi:hypothetical protein
MKQFEIKISGSGTKNQIEISLLEVARKIQLISVEELSARNNIIPFFEDNILCVEINEE